MMYGQLKIASITDDHFHAAFGAVNGALMGGTLGGLKDIGDERKAKHRLRNILVGAGAGAMGGLGFGAVGDHLEKNREAIRNTIHETLQRFQP